MKVKKSDQNKKSREGLAMTGDCLAGNCPDQITIRIDLRGRSTGRWLGAWGTARGRSRTSARRVYCMYYARFNDFSLVHDNRGLDLKLS